MKRHLRPVRRDVRPKDCRKLAADFYYLITTGRRPTQSGGKRTK